MLYNLLICILIFPSRFEDKVLWNHQRAKQGKADCNKVAFSRKSPGKIVLFQVVEENVYKIFLELTLESEQERGRETCFGLKNRGKKKS